MAGGFFDGLLQSIENPLFLGGVGLMSGGGDGLQKGLLAGNQMLEQRKKQAQQQALQQGIMGMPNLTDQDKQILANSPELATHALSQMYGNKFDPMADLKRKTAEANLAQTQQENGMFPLKQKLMQAQIAQAQLRHEPKLMEVNGRIVRVPASGPAEEVYNAGPDPSKLPPGYSLGKPGPNGEVTYQAIPGGPHDPSKPTASITTSAAQAKQAHDALMSELDNYNALVQKNGAAVMPGTEKDQLLQSRRNIQLQAKELYNLGVLNGPDMMLMDNLLPDASVNSPLDLTNAYDTKNRVNTGVGTLKEKFRNLANVRLQSAQMPTIPNAGQGQVDGPQLAPDGNWYVKDPARPGKFLKVQH